MTWLTIARFAVPYALCIALGFGMAWKIQGVRVEALKSDVKAEAQKLTDYKLSQEAAKIAAEKEAEKRRKETADEYQSKLDKLAQDHEIFRRCVAAGKCGAVRVPVQSGCGSGITAAPTARLNATSPDPISVADESATPQVVNDCAITTLMLNRLQADIEAQPGY